MRSSLLLAFALGSIACGSDVQGDCLAVCEKSKPCTETEADCQSLCKGVAGDAEATGCESETNDYYACRLDAAACDAAACDAELGEVTVCKLDFCLENPKHRLCDVDG
jgi:hypothetical protein